MIKDMSKRYRNQPEEAFIGKIYNDLIRKISIVMDYNTLNKISNHKCILIGINEHIEICCGTGCLHSFKVS